VDFNDLVILAQNYNRPVPAQVLDGNAAFNGDLARAFAAVPEPTALGVIGIISSTCFFRIRRRK
jgi:hypothetical protein